MKWNSMGPRLGRSAKAVAVSLALTLGVTACSRDYTVAYLYVTAKTSATTGLIDAYAIDYQSGSLLPLADSPIPTNCKNPGPIAVMPDGTGLFVACHDDSSIIAYNIGTDGKLYPTQTVTITTTTVGGSFPTALSVSRTVDASNAVHQWLNVTYTYNGGLTSGPGGISIFPITETTSPATVSLGTPTSVVLGHNPVSVATVLPTTLGAPAYPRSGLVFVVEQEVTTANIPAGVIRAFTQDSKTGALAEFVATTKDGFPGFDAGTLPGSVVVDPTGRFVYVSDESTNQILGNVLGASSLTPMTSSPFPAGNLPMGMTIDPRGTFLFVANYNSNTVNGYTIDGIKGNLTATGTTTVATGPTCVTIENALGKYLFTSNQLDDSVSGEQMDAHTGSLTGIQGTQFNTSHLPGCTVAIANGAHASQLVVN